MTEQAALELLNQLAYHQHKLDALTEEKETKVRGLIPIEVLEEQERIAAGYIAGMINESNIIADLRSTVELAVIREGHTVNGDMLMAVYNKGRETWDGKLLSGFALAHPEIEAARKVGNPTISIRKI